MIETWTVIGILGAFGAALLTMLGMMLGQFGKLNTRIDESSRDLRSEMRDFRSDVKTEFRALGEQIDKRFSEHEVAHRGGR